MDWYTQVTPDQPGHQPSMFLTPISLASMMPGVIESSAQEAVSLSFFFPF